MKKINKTGLFVITIFIITTTSLLGQATDLFFSEYIEGSSYNKALEIFNGTGMDIDLSNYQLWQIGNGGNWPEYTVDISGTLPDGEVFVVCHPDANPTMLAVADLVVTLYHNGNDAQGLAKDDGTGTFYLIDTIGEDGDAPEYGWDVAGVPEATKDHTLVRKASIGNPNTDWNSSAGTNADNSEWIVYDKDTFDYLGSHTFTGGGGDTTPPTLVSTNATSSTTVNLVFSEKISQETAEVVGNYIIDELTVLNAHLQTDSITVTLTTAEQTEGETYTITVNNVEDLAGNPIESNSTIDFTGYQSGGGENDLLFSDYIEGSSNNKALEIYNGTGASANLSNYRIVGSYNGSGWQSSYYSFPEETNLPNGDVWVIANEDADQAILNVADDILAYNEGGYVVSFNGNDARGLEKTSDGRQTWTLIDVIGVPTEDPGDGLGWSVAGEENATVDHTLVRKAAITQGNTDWTSSAGTDTEDSEWIVYPQDTFEYLGSHNAGGEDTTPPSIINLIALSLTSVQISFSEALNDTMAEDENNYSITPSLNISSAELQEGNKVLLTTGEQTPGESYTLTLRSIADTSGNVMADTTVEFTGYQQGEYDLIADIQNNYDDYEGEEVTIRGVVTIGDGLLKPGMTKFYIQDSSEKGIQIYNYSPLSTTYIRGNYIEVTGTVDKYENDVEITNPTVTLLAQEENLPLPHIMVGDEDLTINGTWAKVTGEITDVWDAEEYGFYQITVSVSGTEIPLMFWNSTGVDVSEYEEGDNVKAYGVITFYTDDEGVTTPQLTCGYEEDISLYSGEEYFEITPINPQPYDTVTVTFTCPDNYIGDCDTVRLLWRTVQHLPFKSIIMDPIEGAYNKFESVIPGQPEATIVYFYFAVTDTSSGEITNFPENAPYTLNSYKYDVTSLKAILKVPPKTFCPTLNEKFEIQVHSRKDDKIILRLYNSEGKLVHTFFNKLSNGSESINWDGKDETWNTLPPGLYICHLEVIDRETGKTKTDTAPIVIAVPLKD